MIEIEKHIFQAQRIFIDGKEFDKERIEFIKNLETCDLLAVPGSGKTTSLLAKLYCLAQNMPFKNDSGILILAHTNHAVDEIENKLKRYCPQLFEYPNFVGTIQSFVYKFLASPYYMTKNGKPIHKIDDEIYRMHLDNIILNSYKAIVQTKQIFNTPNIKWKYNFELPDKDGVVDIVDKYSKESIKIEKPKANSKKYEDWNEATKQKIRKNLYDIKIQLIRDGVFNFSDCYFLANKYIERHPEIKTILQKRFGFVFIDEMQDLEKFQIDIIDKIFFGENSETKIQRIGDKNQSIYRSQVKEICDWQTREELEPTKYNDLSIKNSIRLSKTIGNLVNCFVLERPTNYEVIGKFCIDKENIVPKKYLENKSIPPQLILFNKCTSGEQLQMCYESLISKYNLIETESSKKNGFKIIGWNTEWSDIEKKDTDKIRLKDLFPDYSKESKQVKEDFNCLKKHLQLFDQDKKTLEAVRKSILNAFVRVLKYEGIKIEKNIRGEVREAFYTKNDLVNFIKKVDDNFNDSFNSKLFHWCFSLVVKKEYEEIYKEIKEYIEEVLIVQNWYNLEEDKFIPKKIIQAKEFIESGTFNFEKKEKKEDIEKQDLNVEVTSVHSVKGQTHCATMYIETAYQRPTYETLKLNKKSSTQNTSPLYFGNHKCSGSYDKQALKMMYVGFSRPTHLLCFAVLEENVKYDLNQFQNSGWIVVDDLIKANE